MEITASLVKDLREKTGAGMMDCKKALSETAGDFEKAVDYLRKKGIASAAKKAGRATKEGTVTAWVSNDSRSGVVLEINCETDFVARTEQFKALVSDVTHQIAQAKPATLEALMAQPCVKDSAKTIQQLLAETIATLGENMSIRRFSHFEGAADGKTAVISYIHGEGKVGVMVEFAVGNSSVSSQEQFKSYARDVAMHVAAAQPQFVKAEEVSAEMIAKEKEIAVAQMQGQNKPQNVLEKIAEGKIKKFFEEICLVNQPFVKDPAKTITQLTQETAKTLGQDLSIRRFTRFVLGDGLKEAAE
jgi:elongation factor Ts